MQEHDEGRHRIKDVESLLLRPVFVNAGVRSFGDSLCDSGYDVVFVDWKPPAGGDPRIADLLDELL